MNTRAIYARINVLVAVRTFGDESMRRNRAVCASWTRWARPGFREMYSMTLCCGGHGGQSLLGRQLPAYLESQLKVGLIVRKKF